MLRALPWPRARNASSSQPIQSATVSTWRTSASRRMRVTAGVLPPRARGAAVALLAGEGYALAARLYCCGEPAPASRGWRCQMVCAHCRAELPDGAVLCWTCGRQVARGAGAAAPSERSCELKFSQASSFTTAEGYFFAEAYGPAGAQTIAFSPRF